MSVKLFLKIVVSRMDENMSDIQPKGSLWKAVEIGVWSWQFHGKIITEISTLNNHYDKVYNYRL